MPRSKSPYPFSASSRPPFQKLAERSGKPLDLRSLKGIGTFRDVLELVEELPRQGNLDLLLLQE